MVKAYGELSISETRGGIYAGGIDSEGLNNVSKSRSVNGSSTPGRRHIPASESYVEPDGQNVPTRTKLPVLEVGQPSFFT
ncbi:hypothetical protein D3C84_1193710 [compost metagenome]